MSQPSRAASSSSQTSKNFDKMLKQHMQEQDILLAFLETSTDSLHKAICEELKHVRATIRVALNEERLDESR